MLDRALARKLDRLGRAAHAFHRFAHHPLCPAYRSEVVALGRLRLCKGCLSAGAGAVVGAGLGLALPGDLGSMVGLLAVLAGLLAIAGKRRLPKPLGRFLPACMVTLLAVQGLRSGRALGWGLGLAAVLAGALALARYRRRGPNRTPCAGCPEAGGAAVCSGYRAQVRRERAFSRLAGRWIRAAGPRG